MTTSRGGLEGVVVAETRLSKVDGQAGEFVIGGFAVEEVAAQANHEEVVYLLWHGQLPTERQLAAFQEELLPLRPLPPVTLALLRAVAADAAPVMDALRMGAGTLSLALPPAAAPKRVAAPEIPREAMALLARFPTIVAAYWRLRQGLEPLAPRSDLGHAANYLYMLFGETPSTARVRGLETYLNTVSDHGLNASTFTARVITSTQSDLVSAITGAIGALKGPLHGGAPTPALDMVFEIGTADRAEAYLRRKLERGERLMGFGHRVYKVKDPRALVLAAAAAEMYTAGEDQALYRLARHVEETAVRLLAEVKPGRNLQTNVEFYTALLLHGLGLPTELFTPTFAVGRVAGWTAHCLEQQRANRLMRPESAYVGPEPRPWMPIKNRHEPAGGA
jgi:citrate synthase